MLVDIIKCRNVSKSFKRIYYHYLNEIIKDIEHILIRNNYSAGNNGEKYTKDTKLELISHIISILVFEFIIKCKERRKFIAI